MGIIAFLLQLSMLPIAAGTSSGAEIEAPLFCGSEPGTGDAVLTGDLVTIQYSIADWQGKEIANSNRRGLGMTFNVLGSNSDGLLQLAVIGARQNETRTLVVNAEDFFADQSVFSIVRNPGPLLVTVKIERISRR
jgi:hypothetical protein